MQRKSGEGNALISVSLRKKKLKKPPADAGGFFYDHGDNGIRTRDLCVANATLSQLSYVPKKYPDCFSLQSGYHYSAEPAVWVVPIYAAFYFAFTFFVTMTSLSSPQT